MESKDFCCYEFGEFLLDPRRRSLLKSGEKVPLSARNFDLLLFMVENGGRILDHDELLDKVWAGTFVEQATLKKGISSLRQILAEQSETEFIKTIPRRGYTFISPVRIVPEKQEVFLVRETEREIIVEEFEEIDDTDDNFSTSERILDTSFVPKALPSAETKSNKIPRTAIFIGVGIVALLLAFFGLRSYFSRNISQQFSAENVRITRLTNSGKVVSGTAVSPDGNYLLYPAFEKEGVVLWLRQISTNTARKLTSPSNGGYWGFAIAPDNSYIYYIFNDISDPRKSGLYKMPLLGGDPQLIVENVSSVAASPDGKQIALVRIGDSTEVFTVNTNGDEAHTVTTLPANYRLWSVGWTPDSTALLCTIRKIVDDKFLYYVTEISPENSKENIVLQPQERVIYGSAWLPDKSAMLLTVRESNADIRQIWQYFPSSQQWKRVTNDNNSYKIVSVTRDGKTIITSQESRLAAIWSSNGVSPERNSSDKKPTVINRDDFRQITDGIGSFDRIGWLLDGHLVYSATEDGKETIFTVNADGTDIRQLTKGEDGIWIFPTITGNGQGICFISSRSGTKQVWRVDPDGKNLTQMTEIASQVSNARILRDSSTVVYSTQTDTGTKIFRQTGKGQSVQLTEASTGVFAVSSDEKLLAVEAIDKNTRKYIIELHSLEDGKIIKTFNIVVAHQMKFTPDNKNLAYDTASGGTSQIMIQSLEGGDPQPLTDFQTDEIFGFDWSPDGTRLAIIRGKQLNDAVSIKTNDR